MGIKTDIGLVIDHKIFNS